MTREVYYDMCEQLRQEPVEEEIPIILQDFPDIVQMSIRIHNIMPGIWEGMSGSYLGVDTTNLFDLFELFNIESQPERILSIDIIQTLDNLKMEEIRLLRKQQQNSK